MRLVVDASSLVAEVVRERGQKLIAHPALELYIAQHAWDETHHEVSRRIAAMERSGRISVDAGEYLLATALGLIDIHVAYLPAAFYADLEEEARRRIPRDPRDWSTVALALRLDAAIWTHDNDFLGCGIATWTTETLLAQHEP